MSEAVAAAPAEGQTPEFNSAEFIQARNEGKPPAKLPEAKAAAAAAAAEPEGGEPKISRSARREMNRLREEMGALRGRLEAYEKVGIAPRTAPAAAADTPEDASADSEPQRKDFHADAEYQRALGRWDARQEVKKQIASRDETEEFRSHVQEMDAKAAEDRKGIEDWDETAQANIDDENAVVFDPGEHPTLMAMLASSEQRAFVLYYLAKHQDDFERMLDLTKKPNDQIRAFHRLEGRVENLYRGDHSAEAAQASGKAEAHPKDRTHLADSGKPDGRNATAQRDALKPKPTAEVAARGGSAPALDDPAPGSKAWMERRNQVQFAR